MIAAGVAVALWFLPTANDPTARHALAIAAFMVACWISHALEPAVTGLIGSYLFWALGVVTFPVAFGGFADSTTWFIFAAMLLGATATRTGLPRRLAYIVLRRAGTSYSHVLLALVTADLLLTLFVPSGVARVMVMAPVAIGVVAAFGLERGSNVGRGLFVSLIYAATIFDKMILGGLAAITARGAMEQVGVEVLWSRWALACAPGSLITVVAVWRLALWLFPPERAALPHGDDFSRRSLDALGPWSAAEKKVAVLLIAALALWATDFLHGIPAAAVGLGFGLAALLPGIGVLNTHDLRGLNYLPLLFVGSAISLGGVLTATGALTGVTAAMTHALVPLVPDLRTGAIPLYVAACAYHVLLGNEIAMVATSMPSVMQFARLQGLDPLAVGMIWTIGAGGKLFLYQSTVLIVGHSYGYFDRRDVLRIGACVTIVEAAVVQLLAAVYWPWLGYQVG